MKPFLVAQKTLFAPAVMGAKWGICSVTSLCTVESYATEPVRASYARIAQLSRKLFPASSPSITQARANGADESGTGFAITVGDPNESRNCDDACQSLVKVGGITAASTWNAAMPPNSVPLESAATIRIFRLSGVWRKAIATLVSFPF